MIKEIESSEFFRHFVAGPNKEVAFEVFKIKGMAFPLVYARSHSQPLPSLQDVFSELFHLVELSVAHVLVPSTDPLLAEMSGIPYRHLAITRPDEIEHENYHLFEITRSDLDLYGKGLDLSAAKCTDREVLSGLSSNFSIT
jgi:hypothetical protein